MRGMKRHQSGDDDAPQALRPPGSESKRVKGRFRQGALKDNPAGLTNCEKVKVLVDVRQAVYPFFNGCRLSTQPGRGAWMFGGLVLDIACSSNRVWCQLWPNGTFPALGLVNTHTTRMMRSRPSQHRLALPWTSRPDGLAECGERSKTIQSAEHSNPGNNGGPCVRNPCFFS